MFRLLIVFAIIFCFANCKHEKIHSVQISTIDSNNLHCDTLTHISYANQVWPIIKTHCTTCHDSTGSIKLYDYTHVHDFASSGQLYGVLNGNPDLTPMPPVNKLDTCSILIIDTWLKEGMKNN